MQHLYHELNVLSKAIHYKNLSAAALHVGLSQPQLSRIIHKIEEELKIVLLDRSAKRKSGWTTAAGQLAEIFDKSQKRLEAELQSISQNQVIQELHIATLEGLAGIAISVSKICFEHLNIKKVTVDIHDLSDLEAGFLSGNFDIIFTSKSPGRQKYKHMQEVGYQTMQHLKSNKDFIILSSFESVGYDKKELEKAPHVLVSNSLLVKKEWLGSIGGTGKIPSEVQKQKSKDSIPVLMIGSEILSPILWEELNKKI